jgi:ABC-type Fe3+-siderophore transport system permease subunit
MRDRIIIFDIRMPRAILGFLVGGSLAVSGAVMQGLFRNPLADPGLVGVSSGAGLGAVVMIVLGGGFVAPVYRCSASTLCRWRPLAAVSSPRCCSTASPPATARPRSPPCCSPASHSARSPAP